MRMPGTNFQNRYQQSHQSPCSAKECPHNSLDAIKTSGGIIRGQNKIESLKTHHRSYRYGTVRELEDAWQFKMEERESQYQQCQNSVQLNDNLDYLLEALERQAVTKQKGRFGPENLSR